MTTTARPQATSVQHLENGLTRVTEWRFTPGAETGDHVHDYSYVIVPLTAGTLHLEHPDGSVTQADLVPGRSYCRAAGTKHNVINASDSDLAFVEVEFLDAPIGTPRC